MLRAGPLRRKTDTGGEEHQEVHSKKAQLREEDAECREPNTTRLHLAHTAPPP